MYVIVTVCLSVQVQQQAVDYSAPCAGSMPGQNRITAQRILYSRGRCVGVWPRPSVTSPRLPRAGAEAACGAGPVPGQNRITAQRILYSRGVRCWLSQTPGKHLTRNAALACKSSGYVWVLCRSLRHAQLFAYEAGPVLRPCDEYKQILDLASYDHGEVAPWNEILAE